MLLTKYQLTDYYSLHVCSFKDEGAVNGENFEIQNEWVIKEDLDGCVFYTTKSAKKFNINIKCYNPKDAIIQILSYAYTGKTTKPYQMWFRVVKNNNDILGC